MKRILMVFLSVVVMVGAFVLCSQKAKANLEHSRVETLKTDYATWPTNPDGSPVEYPTGGSWE